MAQCESACNCKVWQEDVRFFCLKVVAVERVGAKMRNDASRVGFTYVYLERIFASNLKLSKVILLLTGLLGVSGCEFFYLHYSDCGYYDGPSFDRITLRQPVLNQVYSEQVRVTLDNDRHIDGYDIRLEFSGSLPLGISYYQDDTSVYFEGTAISLGSYSFIITVEARYLISDRFYYNYSDYCNYRTSRNYLLTVEHQ